MIEIILNQYKDSSTTQIILEIIAFVFGILSVLFAKKENILVYPTGLIATLLSVYLLFEADYLGDMIVNIYFSVMSIYGWYRWSKRDNSDLNITITTPNEKLIGSGLFILTLIVVYSIYVYFDYDIKIETYFDILTAGIFFTAMWYMANKKIENWMLWIIGDIIVVPLYAYRGLIILSLQYVIFTVLAILAYKEWKMKMKEKNL